MPETVIRPRVVAVIPTYNERDNIGPLIEQLYALNILDFGIIVVDDRSPDGTAQIVQELMKKYPTLKLVQRHGPAGRGLAGRDGFIYALQTGAKIIVEMDGDFSHRPKDLPKLLAAMHECDVAIGSRLVPGGSDEDRPPWRQKLTHAANFYARWMLGLPVLDTNSGFRCFTREAMEKIDPMTLESTGPSIVHEALYRAVRACLKIQEVPIQFIDRKKGESKLNLSRLIKGYLWILRLRLQ